MFNINMFGISGPKSKQATHNVYLFRKRKQNSLDGFINSLNFNNNIINRQINEVSNLGKLITSFDFDEMNEQNLLNNHDFLYDKEDLNKIIEKLIDYLRLEGFNISLIENKLVVDWPDPNMEICRPLLLEDLHNYQSDTKDVKS